MPKKSSRKSRRLNAASEGDLELSFDTLSLCTDDQRQLDTLREELKKAEKRALEAEHKVHELQQSSAPSSPGSSPLHSNTSPDEPSPIAEEKPAAASPAPVPSPTKSKRSFDVPLPRQGEFDGTRAWEGFIQPFLSLAQACDWSPEEKKFRLVSSLKGRAAEFAFQQLDPSIVKNFDTLIEALESRFAERRTQNTWLALLESRKFQPKDNITEYVADIRRLVMRSYPTADATTRESIALRHFLRGLPDQQIVVAIGMTNPKTLEDARTAVENFLSLRENVAPGKSASLRVHTVQATEENPPTAPKPPAQPASSYVTPDELKSFTEKLDRRLTGIVRLINNKAAGKGNKAPDGKRKMTDLTCYNCNETGHFANSCPQPAAKKEPVAVPPPQQAEN